MDKLDYGNFDSTNTDIAFSATNGYSNPTTEDETRRQLSYPLKEVKEYINKTVPVKNNQAVQLVVTAQNGLQYKTSPSATPIDINTGSSHGIPSGGTTGQVLTKNSNTDYDVSWGSESLDTETIASGDRLVIYDNSASKKAKSSIQFGANANKYLRNDGTWQNVKCGVDMTNILFTKTIAKSDQTLGEFTSDYDGWLRVTNTDGHNTFSLDGVTIPRDADTQRMYLISKGTVIKRVNYYPVGSENDAGMTIVIYGLK